MLGPSSAPKVEPSSSPLLPAAFWPPGSGCTPRAYLPLLAAQFPPGCDCIRRESLQLSHLLGRALLPAHMAQRRRRRSPTCTLRPRSRVLLHHLVLAAHARVPAEERLRLEHCHSSEQTTLAIPSLGSRDAHGASHLAIPTSQVRTNFESNINHGSRSRVSDCWCCCGNVPGHVGIWKANCQATSNAAQHRTSAQERERGGLSRRPSTIIACVFLSSLSSRLVSPRALLASRAPRPYVRPSLLRPLVSVSDNAETPKTCRRLEQALCRLRMKHCVGPLKQAREDRCRIRQEEHDWSGRCVHGWSKSSVLDAPHAR